MGAALAAGVEAAVARSSRGTGAARRGAAAVAGYVFEDVLEGDDAIHVDVGRDVAAVAHALGDERGLVGHDGEVRHASLEEVEQFEQRHLGQNRQRVAQPERRDLAAVVRREHDQLLDEDDAAHVVRPVPVHGDARVADRDDLRHHLRVEHVLRRQHERLAQACSRQACARAQTDAGTHAERGRADAAAAARTRARTHNERGIAFKPRAAGAARARTDHGVLCALVADVEDAVDDAELVVAQRSRHLLCTAREAGTGARVHEGGRAGRRWRRRGGGAARRRRRRTAGRDGGESRKGRGEGRERRRRDVSASEPGTRARCGRAARQRPTWWPSSVCETRTLGRCDGCARTSCCLPPELRGLALWTRNACGSGAPRVMSSVAIFMMARSSWRLNCVSLCESPSTRSSRHASG